MPASRKLNRARRRRRSGTAAACSVVVDEALRAGHRGRRPSGGRQSVRSRAARRAPRRSCPSKTSSPAACCAPIAQRQRQVLLGDDVPLGSRSRSDGAGSTGSSAKNSAHHRPAGRVLPQNRPRRRRGRRRTAASPSPGSADGGSSVRSSAGQERQCPACVTDRARLAGRQQRGAAEPGAALARARAGSPPRRPRARAARVLAAARPRADTPPARRGRAAPLDRDALAAASARRRHRGHEALEVRRRPARALETRGVVFRPPSSTSARNGSAAPATGVRVAAARPGARRAASATASERGSRVADRGGVKGGRERAAGAQRRLVEPVDELDLHALAGRRPP